MIEILTSEVILIDHLRIFITVAEQRHFSKAAELLHLSQPNVSLQIKKLEQEFGAKLFQRSPKYVVLTEAGETLYLCAKQMIQLYDETKAQIDEQRKSIRGKIKIGASFTIGEYVLPVILASYAKEYPEVEVEVKIGNTKQIVEQIESFDLEAAFVEGEVPAHVNAEPFMKDEMILIASPHHALSHLRVIKADMLNEQIWILREEGSGTRAYSDQVIEELQLAVKQSFILSSSQSIKEAIIAGLGIAMLSRLTVQKELENGELVRLPLFNQKYERIFSVIQASKITHKKAVKQFLRKMMHFQTYS